MRVPPCWRFCCSWCSMVRIGTSLCCLVFLVALLVALLVAMPLMGRRSLYQALVSLSLVALACLPNYLFQHAIIAHRDATLASLGNPVTAENSHSAWHSIYIGLAFIPNNEVPEYSDHVAADKVRRIDPTAVFTSAPYEAILRQEVFNLARRRPLLVFGNVLAKSAIVILLAAILLLPARKTLLAYRQDLWIDIAFISGMMVSSLNAILVIPKRPYLLTFVCLTSLYSVVKFSLERFRTNIQPAASDIGTWSATAALSRTKSLDRANK